MLISLENFIGTGDRNSKGSGIQRGPEFKGEFKGGSFDFVFS